MQQFKKRVKEQAQKVYHKFHPQPKALKTIEKFDINKLIGTWYDIADMATDIGEDLYDITTTFILEGQQSITINSKINIIVAGTSYGTNTRKYQEGVIRPKDSSFSKFEIVIGLLIFADFFVLEVGSNYEWLLVGSEDRKYAWIYSRTPYLSKDIIDDLYIKLYESGFNIYDMYFIKQMQFNNPNPELQEYDEKYIEQLVQKYNQGQTPQIQQKIQKEEVSEQQQQKTEPNIQDQSGQVQYHFVGKQDLNEEIQQTQKF